MFQILERKRTRKTTGKIPHIEEFHEKILQLRNSGFTIKELSELAGVPFSVIQRTGSDKYILRENLRAIRDIYQNIEFYKAKNELVKIGNQVSKESTYLDLELMGFSMWEIIQLKK